MRSRIERKHFSLKLALAAACVCVSALPTFASGAVVIRPDVTRSHREELIKRLRVITGWTSLNFDNNGSLRLGDTQTSGGSESARLLLKEAIAGPNVIVLEDASSRTDVAFCRVVRGRWVRDESNRPPAFVVLIDFTDFQQLGGDAEARAAFDVGWGLLHELDHVVKDSEDARDAKAVGECEEHINRMRLEVGLPVRVDYFFSRAYLKADSNFNARYVRLSFERQTKRYWLVWDATTVGGLHGDSQRALAALLGLTAPLSAVQRDDEQSLEGLKNIEVVVKFGHLNGEPEKWQASILQTLEDGAKKKLAEAGVPLYQSDEPGTAVRPKLIFILSLNSVTTTAPPVRVDTQLYQRARLSRDAAKELEVPTWVMYGVGGPLSPKMAFDVFDGQVDLFIKTYNAANPASSEVSRQTAPGASAQLCDTAGSLAGLSSTNIFVSFRRDPSTDARRVLLEKFVQEAAETKLKEAGIKLTRYTNEAEKTGNARLTLYVKLSEPNVHLWDPPVGVESKFYQTVRLVRDPRKQTEAMTWESYDTGQFVKNDSGKLTLTDEVILEVINRQIDEFIKVFKAANNQP